MVEFLNKDRAFAEIVEIVRKADSKVVLISPYIKIPADLLDRLKYMDGKNIKTIVVCRGKDLNDKEKGDLKQLKNLELRFDEDLHAKCFYNEKSMVITSLNLHEHSQQNNREMGVLLSLEEDSNTFREALDEADFIVSNARKDSLIGSIARGIAKEAKAVIDSSTKDKPSIAKTTSRTKREGHCIRCNKSIPYDIDKPYCLSCARLWNKSGGYGGHKEKYCHMCGKQPPRHTTREYPICGSCYWKSRR